jgi:hypothetical protein
MPRAEEAPRRARARTLLIAALLLIVAALAARMLLGARAELGRAEAAADDERVRHLRRAMAYYLPGNPWVRAAHDRLLATARRQRAGGQSAQALASYHVLRSAVLQLRGLTRPYAGSLPEVNRAIAALTSARPDAAAALRGKAGRDKLLRRLEAPPEPHPGWAGLGLFGFLLWVGGACWLLARGLRADASLVRRRFWPLLGLVALGFALFCVGMALA